MDAITQNKLEQNSEDIKAELTTLQLYEPVEKDILIVVKDQLSYVKGCIESIHKNTSNYHIYIWDNASGDETKLYLDKIKSSNIHIQTSEKNLGFIIPNNQLAELGSSPYMILLNSDTLVQPGWDEAMISWLQHNENTAEVGYLGGILDEQCKGKTFNCGGDVDYICGWCACFSRKTYDEFGLFDQENLEFAYCEDSDFSLRLKDAGKEIYALYIGLVHHFQNVTVKDVARREGTARLQETFDKNHAYIARRWGHVLTYDD